MHTLRQTNHKLGDRPNVNTLWDVLFMRPDHGIITIIESVKWNEAVKWVNYLNGGIGGDIGVVPDIGVFNSEAI